MGILSDFLAGNSQTLTSSSSQYARTLPTPQAARTDTGLDIDINMALKVSAWYAADRILSEQFALCPLKFHKRLKGGGSEVQADNPLHRLVLLKPNLSQNAYVFKQHIFSHRFFNGNMFVYKQIDPNTGLVNALIPLAPWRIQVKQKLNGEVYFDYTDADGKIQPLKNSDVIHWPGKTIDGVVGVSMITYAAASIGLAIKQQQHEEWLIENRAEPSGILTMQGKMSKEAYELTALQMKERNEGGKNSGKTLILDNGAKYERTAMTPADMELLANKRFGIADCSRFTGVPESLLSENSHATWNNLTEANRHFLEYGLKSHLVSYEMALNASLIPEKNQGKYFYEFDKSAFREMDEEKRSITVLNQRYAGLLSRDEGRSEFNMVPLGGELGSEIWRPENMAPADSPYKPNNPTAANQNTEIPAPNAAKKEEKKSVKASKDDIKAAFSGIFQQLFGRMHTKTTQHMDRQAKKILGAALVESMTAFFVDQSETYSAELKPTVIGLAKSMGGDLDISVLKMLETATTNLVDQYASDLLVVAATYQSGETFKLPDTIGELAAGKILDILEGQKNHDENV